MHLAYRKHMVRNGRHIYKKMVTIYSKKWRIIRSLNFNGVCQHRATKESPGAEYIIHVLLDKQLQSSNVRVISSANHILHDDSYTKVNNRKGEGSIEPEYIHPADVTENKWKVNMIIFYAETYFLSLSRGCNFSCTNCPNRLISQNNIRPVCDFLCKEYKSG